MATLSRFKAAHSLSAAPGVPSIRSRSGTAAVEELVLPVFALPLLVLLVLGVLVLGVLVATASEGTDSLKPTPPPGVRSKTAASGRKSKRLKVVLFATNANAYLCALLKSALLLSLDVHIIGWGLKPKPGGKPINNVISQTNAAWACKQRSDDLVMGLDAFDAFFTPKAVQKQTLRRRLSAMNASFVWSAETNMFPGFSAYAPSFERRYPSQSPTQYKFLNYGAWLGTGAAACRVMSSCAQQMRKCTLCKPAEAAGKTGWAWFDQHAAQYVLVDDQSTKQALDYQNELFHSGWPDCRDFNFSSYRLKGSGVAPHVLHLNGDAKRLCGVEILKKAWFVRHTTLPTWNVYVTSSDGIEHTMRATDICPSIVAPKVMLTELEMHYKNKISKVPLG